MRGKAVITLDSVDVTDAVIGSVSVRAEESSARLADFTIIPATGSIDVTDWTNKPVTIDYVTFNAAGSTLSSDRAFTGVVDLPVFDPKTKQVRFECTDGYQQRFEAMTESAILAELTGYYSEAVFGVADDGWEYAQDVLSTVPKSFDLNVDGVTGVLTDWAAKVTPDFTFDDDFVLDGSVKIELARKRELFNKSVIDFNYRFIRSLHREHGYYWAVPSWDFCTYYGDSHTLPNREQVESAAKGAGWNIQGAIAYTKLPVSGTYICGGNVVWIISEDLRDQLVRAAGWTSVKRWSQTATEEYELVIQAPQSITHFGEIAVTASASLSTDYDDDGWDRSEDTATPTGATQDAIGDWFINRDDRTESDNAIATKLNEQATSILEVHRRNYVSWSLSLSPLIERSHTLKLDTADYQAQGKVFSVEHVFSESGDITTVKVAISRTGVSAPPTPDALTAPAPPSTGPVIAAPPSSTALGTQLGGKAASPAHDPNEDGFSGNYTAQDFGANVYPHQFKVDSAAIEDDVRNEAVGSASATYNIVIPDELLVISV